MDILKGPMREQWQCVGVKGHHGIALPLFSLHSEKSSGLGEIPDLLPLLHLVKSAGMDLVQLLPINDSGHDPSPYATLSSFALNPLYLGLSSLPYAKKDAEISELQKLNRSEWIDWKSVNRLKRSYIRSYITKHRDELSSDQEFIKFTSNTPWLKSYAEFIALWEESGYRPWWCWKNPKPNAELVKEAMLVQFLLHKQLLDVRKEADRLGILLFGDLPIFVSKNSADAWSHPEIFHFHLEAGAPPDAFNREGQHWGFPPYNWEAIASQGWRHWKWRLQAAEQYYHLYRLDHLVGFFRTYCFPLQGGDGHFVPSEKADWQSLGHRILSAFISMTRMLPIGEDLGIVPDEVREEMRRLTLPGTKVMRWERRWKGDHSFIPPDQYDPLSLTCVSTHDTSLLPLWWTEHREEAKLFTQSFGLQWHETLTPQTHFELLRLSHATSSLFHANLLNEYLALFPKLIHENLRDERINRPGIVSPKNWSLRFKPTVEEMGDNQLLIETLNSLCPDRPKNP